MFAYDAVFFLALVQLVVGGLVFAPHHLAFVAALFEVVGGELFKHTLDADAVVVALDGECFMLSLLYF